MTMKIGMKWRKIGKIFDPTEHELPPGCTEFAQSPQALELKDRVRVFFSTREKDIVGKYLSRVSFVDFNHGFGEVIGSSTEQVIELGGLGCFDEHGVFPIHVFRNGEEIWGYTTGWNRKVSVSADASIGLAISRDEGRTFEKVGKGPVLAAALHEPFLVADPFVLRVGEIWHMYYIFGQRWLQSGTEAQAERVYKIAHAISLDGISWRREGRPIVTDRIDVDECQALPSVLRFNGLYHMVFCYRSAIGFRTHRECGYRLGYAYSTDLNEWIRDDAALGLDVSAEGWDSEMMCYPQLFAHAGRVWLLYNGNHFGRHGFGLAVLDSPSY